MMRITYKGGGAAESCVPVDPWDQNDQRLPASGKDPKMCHRPYALHESPHLGAEPFACHCKQRRSGGPERFMIEAEREVLCSGVADIMDVSDRFAGNTKSCHLKGRATHVLFTGSKSGRVLSVTYLRCARPRLQFWQHSHLTFVLPVGSFLCYLLLDSRFHDHKL